MIATACDKTPKAAPEPKGFAQSKVDIATLEIDKYEVEGLAQWAMAHPQKACPANLAELDEYLSGGPAKGLDPWGHPYRMTCGVGTAAPSPTGFHVTSAGPDGIDNTGDDIRSPDGP